MTVRAPAKVNLSLRVLGRRADGYHELDTRMFAVSLYDELEIRVSAAPRTSVGCRVHGPERVEGGSGNLAARAAMAVLDHLGERRRVAIRLHKLVPFGAGLGGGSSDAAAVIRVLPGLVGRRLPMAEALTLAGALGADVPFFLRCRPSRATGIGDRLRDLERVPAGAMVIAVPKERVATAWAYRHALPNLTSRKGASRFPPFPRSVDAVEAWFFNDFQCGVERSVETVRSARERLLALGARAAVLSGSGSAVVGWFEDGAAARAALERYDGPGKAFVARVIHAAPRPVSIAS